MISYLSKFFEFFDYSNIFYNHVLSEQQDFVTKGQNQAWVYMTKKMKYQSAGLWDILT